MGRPKGSRNMRKAIPVAVLTEAISQLTIQVAKGDPQAIALTIKHCIPAPMAEPVAGGVQERAIEARIYELTQMQAEIAELRKQLEARNV